ncbi:hypothetical protein HDU96_002309, partial [Phlyctochytrium bullatum]
LRHPLRSPPAPLLHHVATLGGFSPRRPVQGPGPKDSANGSARPVQPTQKITVSPAGRQDFCPGGNLQGRHQVAGLIKHPVEEGDAGGEEMANLGHAPAMPVRFKKLASWSPRRPPVPSQPPTRTSASKDPPTPRTCVSMDLPRPILRTTSRPARPPVGPVRFSSDTPAEKDDKDARPSVSIEPTNPKPVSLDATERTQCTAAGPWPWRRWGWWRPPRGDATESAGCWRLSGRRSVDANGPLLESPRPSSDRSVSTDSTSRVPPRAASFETRAHALRTTLLAVLAVHDLHRVAGALQVALDGGPAVAVPTVEGFPEDAVHAALALSALYADDTHATPRSRSPSPAGSPSRPRSPFTPPPPPPATPAIAYHLALLTLLPPRHHAVLHHRLGLLHLRADAPRAALPHLRLCLAVQPAAPAPPTALWAAAASAAVRAELGAGNAAGAVRRAREALARCEEGLGPFAEETVRAAADAVEAAVADGDAGAAVAVGLPRFLEWERFRGRQSGAAANEAGRLAGAVAEALVGVGRWEEAAAVLTRAVERGEGGEVGGAEGERVKVLWVRLEEVVKGVRRGRGRAGRKIGGGGRSGVGGFALWTFLERWHQ